MPRPLIHQPALTGPAAAALYGLEGFNHRVWPHRYTTFTNGQSRRGVLRTTRWMPPTNFDGQLVADLGVVCQQLGYFVADMEDDDGVTPMERIELAVEHARRIGHHVGAARGGGGMGSVALRQILSWAGDEPPTESYAETRAAQLFRGWGIDVWRQVPVLINRKRYRVDFVVRPSRRAARPQVLRPFDGLIVEVDGEEFHSKNN